MLNDIIAVIIMIIILILGTCQTTIAEKNKDIRNISDLTTTTMTIPLPFNSHIADQADDEITYSGHSNLPFP